MSEIDEFKKDMVELQSQMAFQEHTVQTLNEAIASQQQEILTLTRQLELLKLRQEEQDSSSPDSASAGPADERPPHY